MLLQKSAPWSRLGSLHQGETTAEVREVRRPSRDAGNGVVIVDAEDIDDRLPGQGEHLCRIGADHNAVGWDVATVTPATMTFDVLVLDAPLRQSLVTVRSLGR